MNNSDTVVGRSVVNLVPNEVEAGLIWSPNSSIPTRVSASFVVASEDPYSPGQIRGARFDAINDDGEVFGGIYTGAGYRGWLYDYYYIVNAYRWPANWLVNGGEPTALSRGRATVTGTWDGSTSPARLEGSVDAIEYANAHGAYTGLTLVPGDDPFWPTQKGMVSGNPVSFLPVHLNERGLVLGTNWGYAPGGFVLDSDGTKNLLDGATYPIAINDFVRPGVDAAGNPADIPAPQVIGYRLKSPDLEVPAIWEYAPNGQYVFHDLEDLVVKSGVWDFNLRQFWYPQAINDRGAIVSAVDQYDTQWNYQWTHGVLLQPIEFVEVTPVLKDEAGDDIANSNKPKAIPDLNEMVEEPRAGQIPNVAYRTLKIRVSDTMAGDRIKWTMTLTMTPLFTPAGESQARFRGQWPQEHPNRFEASDGQRTITNFKLCLSRKGKQR